MFADLQQQISPTKADLHLWAVAPPPPTPAVMRSGSQVAFKAPSQTERKRWGAGPQQRFPIPPLIN